MQNDSIQKELIISAIPQETRVAVLEDDELVEFIIERHRAQNIAGNIYKGRVTKVLPGMQSAFVNIGLDRDAFLYVSDFFDDTDEYERIVASAEDEAHGGPDRARASKSTRGEGRRSGRGEARSDTRETRSDTRETRSETRETRSETRETRSDPREPREGGRSDTRTDSRSQEPVDRGERGRNDRNRKERVDRAAESRPRAEPRPERSESETSGKPSDRRGSRRGEQRERKGRIRSFEPAKDPQSSSRTLELLPGESLARHADGPDVPAPADVDDELALVIDETAEPPILDTYPSEAGTSVDDADEGETAEDETFDSLEDAVLGPDDDVSNEQLDAEPEEPADEAAAPDDSLADADGNSEDSEDSFEADGSAGDDPSDE